MDTLEWKKVPCSCNCGGSEAWVFVYNGYSVMFGCICHNVPNDREAYRLIEALKIPEPG